jgi:hypothetical protein
MGKEEYDLILPLGIKHSILGETSERFDVKLTTRGESGELVLRGSREEVEKAKDFIYAKMKDWVSELEKMEKSPPPRL